MGSFGQVKTDASSRVIPRLHALFTVLLLLLVAESAQSDVRVLISYDATGHRVDRVIQSPVNHASDRTLKTIRSIDHPLVDLALNAQQPVVNWYGEKGNLLESRRLPDPRVTHAPVQRPHNRLSAETFSTPLEYFWRDSGVYLLVGPADASEVRVFFPPMNGDSLTSARHSQQAQTWVFSLR